LTVDCPEGAFTQIKDLIAVISDYEDPFEDNIKWYDHDLHMRQVSLAFPGVLLTLNGEGEESGDIWVKYYLNGKMQYERAKIVLGPFDPSKLK